jgi:ribosome-binding factor A
MKSYPRSRVTGEKVREVVARALIEDVKDPRVELVTVTGVAMSPDNRHANVFVIARGPERYAEALAGLDSAKGRIRTTVGRALRMKYVPDLHFAIDPTVDNAERITAVIMAEIEAGRGPVDRDDDADDTPADE